MQRILSQIAYTLSCGLYRPTPQIMDAFLKERLDSYMIEERGGPRFSAISKAGLEHFGPCESMLDASIYSGIAAAAIAEAIGARRIVGLDISSVALERARATCAAFDVELFQFDLSTLMSPQDAEIPGSRCDVVLVSEVLYNVGRFARQVWRYPALRREAKKRLLLRLLSRADRGLIIQHWGEREKHAIAEVAQDLGGRCVNDEFGVVVIESPKRA